MSLKIDYSINDWLTGVNIREKQLELNKLLKLGNDIINLSEITFNPHNNLLNPITEKVENLDKNCNTIYNKMENSLLIYNNDSKTIKEKIQFLDTNIKENLERQYEQNKKQQDNLFDLNKKQQDNLFNLIYKLTGDISTSSIKGKIGENFLENLLKQNFPDDNIIITSSSGHESDLHIESKTYPTILVESKLYRNPVSTKEVDKFISDLETTGIDYGIFVSISSSIMCHRRLEFKQIKNKKIIFIPNAGFDSFPVVYGILFLREISNLDDKNISMSNQLIQEKCDIIYDSLQYLDELYENILKIKNDTFKSKNIIENQINNLISSVIETEILSKNLINKIKLNISDSLSDLNNNIKVIELNNLDKIIKEYIDSDNKLFTIIGSTLNIFKTLKYNIFKDPNNDTKFIIKKDNFKSCELKIAKGKASYIFLDSGLRYDLKNNIDILEFQKIINVMF